MADHAGAGAPQQAKTVQPYSKSGRLLRTLYGQRYLQVMVLLGVLWMLVFHYWPMYGIIIAFKDYIITEPISEASWAGLDYFREFVEDDQFLTIVRNTLGIGLLKLIVGFPIPIVFALFLNELRSLKFKRAVQTISYLPHFLSWVILGGIVITWLSDVGIINDVLMKLGLIKEPIVFLADPKYFWSIVIASDIWKELGWSAIIYLAAIAGVSPDMYEAATIDGAGRFQKMWYVTLPSIKTAVTILLILSVGQVLNSNFDQIFILRNSLNESASTVVDIYVYQTGITQGRFSFSAAVGLLKSVIALVLLLGANYATKKINHTSLF